MTSGEVPTPTPYLELAMPERFRLEARSDDGGWIEEAVCIPQEFDRLPDGSYIRSSFGAGLWIRCVEIRSDGSFIHQDGAGQRHRYRLVPLPDPID